MLILMGCIIEKFITPSFEHPKVKELLNNHNEEFDLVIVEQCANDAQKIFAHHFQAPLVALSPVGSGRWINPLVGNPAPRSFVIDTLTADSGTMNF